MINSDVGCFDVITTIGVISCASFSKLMLKLILKIVFNTAVIARYWDKVTEQSETVRSVA